MKKLLKNQKGVTLMELLVYIGLSTLIVVIMTDFITDASINAAKVKISKEVQQNARFALSRLTTDIRKAQTTLINDPQTLTLDNQTKFELKDDGVYYDDNVSDANPGVKITSNQVKLNINSSDPNQSKFENINNTILIKLTLEQSNSSASASETSRITLSSAAVPRTIIY